MVVWNTWRFQKTIHTWCIPKKKQWLRFCNSNKDGVISQNNTQNNNSISSQKFLQCSGKPKNLPFKNIDQNNKGENITADHTGNNDKASYKKKF